jgi:hypothetical protein
MRFLRGPASNDSSHGNASKATKESDKQLQKLVSALLAKDAPGSTRSGSSGQAWMAAAASLSMMGDRRAIDPLFERLARYNDNNWCLFDALSTFKEEDVARRIIGVCATGRDKWLLRTRERMEAALVSIGEPAVGPICEELVMSEGEGRLGRLGPQLAARLLRDIGSPYALPCVSGFVRSHLEGSLPLANVHPLEYSVQYLADQNDADSSDLIAAVLARLVRWFDVEDTSMYQYRSAASILATACIDGLAKTRNEKAMALLESIASHPKAGHEAAYAQEALRVIRGEESYLPPGTNHSMSIAMRLEHLIEGERGDEALRQFDQLVESDALRVLGNLRHRADPAVRTWVAHAANRLGVTVVFLDERLQPRVDV